MKKATYEQMDEGRQPRFMTYMRVGRFSLEAALMEKQRMMILEFVQQVRGVVARSWEIEGGADSPQGLAAREEMLAYARENVGTIDGLLVCGVDRLTRQGSQAGVMLSAELAAVGVKIVSLPTLGDGTEWAQVSKTLDWRRAKERRDDNQLHGPQRVVAVVRVSSREPGAEDMDRQRKQLEAYARKAGFELNWLPLDRESE